MDLLGITTLVNTIITRIFPDKTEATKATLEFQKMVLNGELATQAQESAERVEQIKTNQAEAASGSSFNGGWRPLIGYVLAVSLACYFIPQFLLGTYFWTIDMVHAGHVLPFPLENSRLWELVGGMLGLAGLRTAEKVKGVVKP